MGKNRMAVLAKFPYQRLSVVLILAALFAVPHSVAPDAAPDALLKSVTRDVVAVIRQDETMQSADPAKIAELLEARMLPLFDFTRMTQIAVARVWRLATPAQQKALTTEFTLLLVHDYAASLSRYRDQIIEFKPLRVVYADTAVTVRTVVKQSGMAPILMNYEMERTAAGWKVYDIKIDGISLISAYREIFAGKVRDGGLEGLIQLMTDKNQQGALPSRSPQREDFYFPIFVWGILQGGR